ncbi:hypothetical protein LLG96_14505 [bacterium]|nr:hypothetical protein [bacterium]
MKCTEFEDNIAAYLEGFIDENLRRAMDEHRTACPACARLAKAHSLILKSLDAAEPVKAPDGLADRILAGIAGEARGTEKVTEQGREAILPVPGFTCETFEENIAAYVDGLLKGNLVAAMNAHRAACPRCERMVHVHNFVLTSLNAAEPVAAPNGLRARILAAVEALETQTVRGTARVYPRYGLVAALVAAVGSFFIAFMILTKELYNNLPDITGKLNQWDTLKTHITLAFVQVYNWVASPDLFSLWHKAGTLLLEPVTIPKMTYSIPAYYLIAMTLLSVAAWLYFREPEVSEASVTS